MLFYLGLLLCISSVSGLDCLFCSSDSGCSSERNVTCPSSSPSCLTSGVIAQNVSFNPHWKNCAEPFICPKAGNQTLSFTMQGASFFLSGRCCDTDNCNTETITAVAPPAGSLQCHSCNPFTNQCSTVTCNAEETLCFNVQVLQSSSLVGEASGCMSRNACDRSVLTLVSAFSGITVNNESCCNTSLCNRPQTTAATPTSAAATPTNATATSTSTTEAPPTTVCSTIFCSAAGGRELSVLGLMGALLLTFTFSNLFII